MQFSELMNSLRRDGDRWSATVPGDWMQGRSVYGGLQAALALQAMRAFAPAGVPIRTLQVCFIAPVPAGPVVVEAQVLRQGKSAIHAQAQLMAGDQVLCIALGVFGARRESAAAIVPSQPPVASAKPISFRYVPDVTPVFTKHFSARILQGAFPFTGASGTDLVVDLGMDDAGPVTPEHVLALADFIWPIALTLLKKPAPGSSLTWMVEFLCDDYGGLSLEGWRVDASLRAARDGYSNQSAMLWGPGGVPVALSRQSMVIFG